jgi:hypothetical protein
MASGWAPDGAVHIDDSITGAVRLASTTSFQIARVQGLAALHRYAEAIELIEETIQSVNNNGDLSFMPDLLHVKGNLLLSLPDAETFAGETCLRQSLD